MIANLLGLWRYGIAIGLLVAASVWHMTDKANAVAEALLILKAEYINQSLAASESARIREKQLQTKVEEARNAAAIREKTLLADAGRARLAADRLRDEIDAARVILPGLTRAAVERYADAASVVFDKCVREYQGLAEQADRLVNDRQTLIDPWPR